MPSHPNLGNTDTTSNSSTLIKNRGQYRIWQYKYKQLGNYLVSIALYSHIILNSLGENALLQKYYMSSPGIDAISRQYTDIYNVVAREKTQRTTYISTLVNLNPEKTDTDGNSNTAMNTYQLCCQTNVGKLSWFSQLYFPRFSCQCRLVHGTNSISQAFIKLSSNSLFKRYYYNYKYNPWLHQDFSPLIFIFPSSSTTHFSLNEKRSTCTTVVNTTLLRLYRANILVLNLSLIHI